MGEAFSVARGPKLWIGEGDPYFRHFSGGEVRLDLVDLRPQEGHVEEPFFQCLSGAHPDAVSFDVCANEVPAWVHPGHSDGVLAFSAGQLECDGLSIAEVSDPLTCHVRRVLEHVGERGDFSEADELFLSHAGSVSQGGSMR